MLFFKLLLPVFALGGLASLAFAAPSPPPVSVSDNTVRDLPNELNSRQLDTIQGIVESLQQELTPVLAKISQSFNALPTLYVSVPNRV